MISYWAIGLAAMLASGLTLFSGFGLGTLVLPVFALFFPLPTAITLTAIVHLLNNFFKLLLFGREADRGVITRFGVPAALFSFLGAMSFLYLSRLEPLFQYVIGSRVFEVHPLKLTVGTLLIFFSLVEALPTFGRFAFEKKYLWLGGALSGFFGGLSGQQGALRSAFLIRCGLTKEGFIATGVVIACLVDVARLVVYGSSFSSAELGRNAPLLATAVLCAFLGAFVGGRLVKKVTLRFVQAVVAVMLFGIGVGLGAGWVGG